MTLGLKPTTVDAPSDADPNCCRNALCNTDRSERPGIVHRTSARRYIGDEITHARMCTDMVDAEESTDAKIALPQLPPNTIEVSDSEAEEPSPVEYAIAFDIDGVLLRGGDVIPGASESLRILNGENKYGIRVPYIFLTNGGGKSEEYRCNDLSQKLGIPVSTSQFIQSHTPMRMYAEKYKTVFVVGGHLDSCRQVALEYGFKDPVIPLDVIASSPSIAPFHTLTEEETAVARPRDFSKLNIEAIFVFADSRAWASDMQVILELLTSENGRFGTRSSDYEHQIPIFFSNPDVIWATQYSLPRFGMGALRKCIEVLYEDVTHGHKLHCIQLGKPYATTYDYAMSVLSQWRWVHNHTRKPPRNVYMVGDNPESDIKGANEHGWKSVLVRSGVFQPSYPGDKANADYVCDNVLEAVRFIIQLEFVHDRKMQALD
ncbi:hypothetical protein SJAG_02328 [Schizosaccharomyces japonicus yFS275]|uniref:Uncharacterized protein n=1 Tax=Schizosaccharomyces japonicus (strain yFS275 / FY16936) TaxID=402676 RepID=B6K262_SCHJY|nr:hypothetical protein SJAG_02328 [Schizosaccharomyces japonicus yFS275]EEB07243.1 hypothetical protein SJAG_02328 [Schizosaccharomyces japonicus yFS275]